MALKGSLEDFGLADILQLIHFQKKSGVLTLEGKRDKVRLFFMEGNIVGAISKKRQEENRLGKVLLKRGLLKEEDLQAVLEEQRKTNRKLGDILLSKSIVDKKYIKEVLTNQVAETVVQIFSWEKGTYEFSPQAIAFDTVSDQEVSITLDTQYLLMEGLRIIDEWSLLEGKLTLDTVFTKKVKSPTGLSDEEEIILSNVDGENDLSTIIDISGEDGFEVAKILFSLMEKGVIEPKEAVPVAEAPFVEVKESKSIIEPQKIAISFASLSAVVITVAIMLSILFSLYSVFLNRDDTFTVFKASKSVEDLRFRVEAYRFEYGAYPDTLGVISNKLDPWDRPYIYSSGEGTFILMSVGKDGKAGTKDDIY